MGVPTRSLENLSLVLQNQKINDFFDRLGDMKKQGSRKIRLELMEGEKSRIRGRTIRLLPSKKELHDKVSAILNKSDIREANRLVLSLVSKGLGIIEEQDVDGNIRATMTPEAHKRYKENQQKPKTAADNNKKRVAYSNVTEVSKEEFHKLAKVACEALKIELEPLKQEKQEVKTDPKEKEKEVETNSHAKPHLKETSEPLKETHDAPSDAETSQSSQAKEESQSKKILEEQQAHAAADREKEKANLEKEKAAAVVRKEIKKEEHHEELVKAEVTAAEQTKNQLKESLAPSANPASKSAPPAAQMMPNVNPAVLKPVATSQQEKSAASSISDEQAVVVPPPQEGQ